MLFSAGGTYTSHMLKFVKHTVKPIKNNYILSFIPKNNLQQRTIRLHHLARQTTQAERGI